LEKAGEAGIDKDAEIARMKAVTDAAKATGMKVLVMHIGGKGRRGTLTDMLSSRQCRWQTN
jgi:hypothetical protein